ncbi:MAG: DUF2946 family protein [Burkholderiales bacterium]|nr:DUF2946 family protein [Burkholderiales bacterium]
MDSAVLQAMVKWPSVPSVYGWLALDRRGKWTIKGEAVGNPAVIAFIGRNYARDDHGRWFFQNGPQRVFVRFAYTPYILHAEPGADGTSLVDHTGEAVSDCGEAFLDEDGCLLIVFERGIGLVSDRDLASLLPGLLRADGAAAGDDDLDRWMAHGVDVRATLDLGWTRVALHGIRSRDVPARFGFDADPRPAPGEPEC